MAKTRYPGPGRRGRGLVWLVATLLALALAGLGLEHGGGSNPTSVNGILSAHTQTAPPNHKNHGGGGGGNVNPPGEDDQGPGANPSADDANGHSDHDCDSPNDTTDNHGNPCGSGGGGGNPPPQKCPKAHDDEGAEKKAGTSETKDAEKAEHQQENADHKACEMSAHHHH